MRLELQNRDGLLLLLHWFSYRCGDRSDGWKNIVFLVKHLLKTCVTFDFRHNKLPRIWNDPNLSLTTICAMPVIDNSWCYTLVTLVFSAVIGPRGLEKWRILHSTQSQRTGPVLDTSLVKTTLRDHNISVRFCLKESCLLCPPVQRYQTLISSSVIFIIIQVRVSGCFPQSHSPLP